MEAEDCHGVGLYTACVSVRRQPDNETVDASHQTSSPNKNRSPILPSHIWRVTYRRSLTQSQQSKNQECKGCVQLSMQGAVMLQNPTSNSENPITMLSYKEQRVQGRKVSLKESDESLNFDPYRSNPIQSSPRYASRRDQSSQYPPFNTPLSGRESTESRYHKLMSFVTVAFSTTSL